MRQEDTERDVDVVDLMASEDVPMDVVRVMEM